MKKALKKLLGTLLTLAMLTTLLNVTVFAAAPAYTYLEVGKATYTDLSVGSEIQIPVSLANLGTGQYLSGFSFTLKDTEYLTVKSVAFADTLSSWDAVTKTVTGGKYYEKMNGSFSSNPSTSMHTEGLIFTVTYTVKKAIPETTAVNPSITDVYLNKTSTEYLNGASGGVPTKAERDNSVVYPDNGSIYLEKVPPASEGYTFTIAADKSEVYMDQIVTVTVKVTGGVFSGAKYGLTYDTDKFAPVTPQSGATAKTAGNGYDHYYLDTSAAGTADGTVIGTYTFKALAQDTEVTGNFTLDSYAAAENMDDAFSGNETADAVSGPASVTIKLIPAGSTDPEGLTVFADDVEKPYDGNAYGVTATANKTGATIRYRDASGSYTLTESPKYKDVGEYTVYFKATLKGYADATGSATVKITEPVYHVESEEYVAGYSLVQIYTNTTGLKFTYDGRTMYDVTNAGYTPDTTTDTYTTVYAVVVEGSLDTTKVAYTASTTAAEKIVYSNDVNGSGKVDMNDTLSVVAVYNTRGITDANMMIVLRADVDHSKEVDASDWAIVKAAEAK